MVSLTGSGTGTYLGRPIVFTLNGQTYFAYTQDTPPNFGTSPSVTAASMTIVSTSDSGVNLSPAHIDSSDNLINANGVEVGYSYKLVNTNSGNAG